MIRKRGLLHHPTWSARCDCRGSSFARAWVEADIRGSSWSRAVCEHGRGQTLPAWTLTLAAS
eukprot:6704751-Prorocentrum_lima.AAC.1